MKKTMLLAMVGTLFLACGVPSESGDVSPVVRGTWTGEGRFLDRKLADEYGTFPVTLQVHPDDSVSGTVGGAPLEKAVVKARSKDYLIEGRLAAPVFPTGSLPGEKKDCIVFILTRPESGDTSGNIHLKTNHVFDLNMRVLGVELTQSASYQPASYRLITRR